LDVAFDFDFVPNWHEVKKQKSRYMNGTTKQRQRLPQILRTRYVTAFGQGAFLFMLFSCMDAPEVGTIRMGTYARKL
jgi:hypothetical protein